jgi:hypothetical protein
LRTTPGDPRSIKKFDSASTSAAPVRTESCNHEAGTIFYAIAIMVYQLPIAASIINGQENNHGAVSIESQAWSK